MWSISWLANSRLASYERPCSMEKASISIRQSFSQSDSKSTNPRLSQVSMGSLCSTHYAHSKVSISHLSPTRHTSAVRTERRHVQLLLWVGCGWVLPGWVQAIGVAYRMDGNLAGMCWIAFWFYWKCVACERCIEISVVGSVALVLECDMLLFVTLLLQYIVD